MNVVKYLQSKILTYEDRLSAKELGPPRPDLSIQVVYKDKNRTYNRHFNKSMYEKWEWMCGCSEVNSFFCFPCLLFGGDEIWTKTGIRDLKHLADKCKKHGLSKVHLNNETNLAVLGNLNIRLQLDDAYRLSIRKHNELVDKNRYILSRIIDAIKFCGEFELGLRGHDETEESNNPGIFKGLINYTAALDSVLKDHLENSTVFKGTSKTIQNELLDAILSVCRNNIMHEIGTADFLSIQADETTDNSCKTQMSLILRYQMEGRIIERFWGFFEVTDRSAHGLTAIILEQLNQLGINKTPDKLICQTFDGASVMSGERGGVRSLIKEKYPKANFIHCYAHQGNLILQKATSSSSHSRIFFQDLQGIGSFFSRSPKRMDYLVEFVQRRIGSVPPTRWYFQHRAVNTVFEQKDNLIKCFEQIRDTEVNDTNASGQAAGFIRTLKDPQFLFWLSFYQKIMPHVAIFFDCIQQKNTDAVRVKDFVSHFVRAVSNVRKQYEDIEKTSNEPKNKRRCTEHGGDRIAALEVCDTIVANIEDRFQFSDHLCVSKLFFVDKFPLYCVEFPENDFQTTLKLHPTVNGPKLRTELEVLYGREDMRTASGATALLQFFFDNNMLRTFSECVMILKIIVTIPMTTVEAERSFSTLNRIKTFLRSSMGNDRLTSLAMLSVEKKMVHNIAEFNNKVIEVFAAAKNRRMEFIYKK